MLIILGSLRIGGIETFVLRLCKKRYERGLKTKILLKLDKKFSNTELYTEVEKYAKIYQLQELFNFPSVHEITKRFSLILPLNKYKINELVEDINQIHVTGGYGALLASKIIKMTNIKVPLTCGIYHSKEFIYWGKDTPSFIKIENDYVLNYIPKENINSYSETIIKYYEEKQNINLVGSNIFRIGVIENTEKRINLEKFDNNIKICSIGRIVDFKTYNFWMIDVIKSLIEQGVSIIYDIYGDGEEFDNLKKLIDKKELAGIIKLKGILEYGKIEETLLEYNLFIGSGTTIIQAAALGIPSIVGIESIKKPLTYGFFCDVSTYDYNIDGLDIKKIPVEDLILNYYKQSLSEKKFLSEKHIESVTPFLMETTVDNFEKLNCNKIQEVKISFFDLLVHEMNLIYYSLLAVFTKRHPLYVKYEKEGSPKCVD
jgi:glycosyltransferase involved in cell wall biosynthesis